MRRSNVAWALWMVALSLNVVAFPIAAQTNEESDEVKEVEEVKLKTPTKKILVIEGDSNRSYTILGDVEYTLPDGVAYGSTLDVPMEAQKLLKDGLKKVAFTEFGNKVDAIITVKMGKQISGGFFGTFAAGFGAKNSVVNATGVAVSFK